ncbi:MAG: ACT domain-containing protein [Eubacteriales bacterium]|nr:ACT domain-containing protein [Eubacteriales bacterium]
MAIKQISAFMENKPGKLSELVEIIADADVNLRAMSLADTNDFGILRVIASDTEKFKEIIEQHTVVTVTEVVAVEMPDEVGALSKILKVLGAAQINIEYMYAFTSATKLGAYTVLRVDDVAAAEELLTGHGFTVLTEADI